MKFCATNWKHLRICTQIFSAGRNLESQPSIRLDEGNNIFYLCINGYGSSRQVFEQYVYDFVFGRLRAPYLAYLNLIDW